MKCFVTLMPPIAALAMHEMGFGFSSVAIEISAFRHCSISNNSVSHIPRKVSFFIVCNATPQLRALFVRTMKPKDPGAGMESVAPFTSIGFIACRLAS